MKFKIGQVFDKPYPIEVAEWCNANNAHTEKVNNTYVIVENQPYKPSYKEQRAGEFPSIGDQLDMIYHDHVDGTDTWVKTIGEIKKRYPKEKV